jgi:hypothetical protein
MGSRLNLPSLDDRKLKEASEAEATIHNASVSTLPDTKHESTNKSIHTQSRIQTVLAGALRGIKAPKRQPLLAAKTQRTLDDLDFKLVNKQKWS